MSLKRKYDDIDVVLSLLILNKFLYYVSNKKSSIALVKMSKSERKHELKCVSAVYLGPYQTSMIRIIYFGENS